MAATSRKAIPGVSGIVGPGLARRIAAVLCAALMFVGAAMLVWVWAEPQVSAMRAQDQVTRMRSEGANLDSPSRLEELTQAEAYNATLAGDRVEVEVAPYEDQLTWPAGDAMGWLEIPAIGVEEPIYHGDSDEVLMLGAGHIEGTSLPVGGESTHCVVTGHSGMHGNYMLDDLGQLEEGDTFVLWALSEPHAYRVYDTEVVEPDDVSSLGIQRGRDLATLITCTPYRINTHRLLVHGERCAYSPVDASQVGTRRPTHWGRLASLLGGTLAMAALPFVWSLMVYGLLVWGRRDDGQLWLGPLHRARMRVGTVKVRGRWSRSSDGRVTVRFSEGDDLARAVSRMNADGAAEGGEYEAVGDLRRVYLRNLANGMTMTFE